MRIDIFDLLLEIWGVLFALTFGLWILIFFYPPAGFLWGFVVVGLISLADLGVGMYLFSVFTSLTRSRRQDDYIDRFFD